MSWLDQIFFGALFQYGALLNISSNWWMYGAAAGIGFSVHRNLWLRIALAQLIWISLVGWSVRITNFVILFPFFIWPIIVSPMIYAACLLWVGKEIRSLEVRRLSGFGAYALRTPDRMRTVAPRIPALIAPLVGALGHHRRHLSLVAWLRTHPMLAVSLGGGIGVLLALLLGAPLLATYLALIAGAAVAWLHLAPMPLPVRILGLPVGAALGVIAQDAVAVLLQTGSAAAALRDQVQAILWTFRVFIPDYLLGQDAPTEAGTDLLALKASLISLSLIFIAQRAVSRLTGTSRQRHAALPAVAGGDRTSLPAAPGSGLISGPGKQRVVLVGWSERLRTFYWLTRLGILIGGACAIYFMASDWLTTLQGWAGETLTKAVRSAIGGLFGR